MTYNPMTSTLPSSVPTTRNDYTSEADIRDRVATALSGKTKAARSSTDISKHLTAEEQNFIGWMKQASMKAKRDPEAIEAWIQRLIEGAKRRNVLMTDKQHADWLIGRRLSVGDKVRYVGPTRPEPVGNTVVPRPNGQTGMIVSAMRGPTCIDGFIPLVLRFMPDLPIDNHVVSLEVIERTTGWLYLERTDA